VRLLHKDLSCREFVELVTAYLEGALPRRDRTRFERHIASCGHCTTYLGQMRATIRLTGMLTEDDVPPAGRAELLAAFRDWHASG
jgi:anti-sigma factor RsiW